MAGKTVTVGCRLPAGLVLQLRDKTNQNIVLVAKPVIGCATKDAPFVREFGAGFTEVDSDLWEAWSAWAAENKFEPFLQGVIFAAPTRERAQAMARERMLEQTLMEGLNVDDPKKDPRLAAFHGGGLAKLKE